MEPLNICNLMLLQLFVRPSSGERNKSLNYMITLSVKQNAINFPHTVQYAYVSSRVFHVSNSRSSAYFGQITDVKPSTADRNAIPNDDVKGKQTIWRTCISDVKAMQTV